jgi:hypothetical protein
MATRQRSKLAQQTVAKATLTDLYAAAALTGILASQRGEPDQIHTCEWAHRMGRRMALASARRQRPRK